MHSKRKKTCLLLMCLPRFMFRSAIYVNFTCILKHFEKSRFSNKGEEFLSYANLHTYSKCLAFYNAWKYQIG